MGGHDRSVPPALGEALALYPGFDSGSGPVEVRAIGEGLLHESFAVSTSTGEYIAQRVSPIFAPSIHENIRAVTKHLVERDCTTVTLCETRGGALFVDLHEAGRWRLMERLPGVTFETCSDTEQARSAGALVGEFHGALADLRTPLAPMGIPYHDTRHHMAELRAALGDCGDHPRVHDVEELAARVFDAVERVRPPLGLPLRVVHGDLKFSNVLFAGSEGPERNHATALIDLDTLCRLPIYFDMGDAWRSWSNRRPEDDPESELDTTIFAAAAEGYLSNLDWVLGSDERASLACALENVALELCARFATDVLREQYFAWDPRRFPSRAEHNWARARGQFSLYLQARETATERLRALD